MCSLGLAWHIVLNIVYNLRKNHWVIDKHDDYVVQQECFLCVIVCKCPAVLTPPPNVSWVRCGLICAHGTIDNESDKHYLFRSGGNWGSNHIIISVGFYGFTVWHKSMGIIVIKNTSYLFRPMKCGQIYANWCRY